MVLESIGERFWSAYKSTNILWYSRFIAVFEVLFAFLPLTLPARVGTRYSFQQNSATKRLKHPFRIPISSFDPVGRVDTPEEIASAVLWLRSPGAAFITGQDVIVDGRYTAQ